jgi:hypothetical protein
MVTIGVVNGVAPAVGKTLDQQSGCYNEQHTLNKSDQANLGNYSVGEDGGIAQKVADGQVEVQVHEYTRLHACKHVDKKHLQQAGSKVNLLETEPKDA